jgi:hypothetical protein
MRHPASASVERFGASRRRAPAHSGDFGEQVAAPAGAALFDDLDRRIGGDVLVGAEVGPVGLEPTTYGLKVRSSAH